MKTLAKGIAVVAIPVLGACGPQGEGEAIGTVAGAVIGGLAGSEVGSGGGRDIAIASGAVLGALLGGEIGRRLDEHSRMTAQNAQRRALDGGRVGEAIVWESPNNAGGPASGQVIVVQSGQDTSGRTCREYNHEVTIAGETETVVGVACLGDDGRWTKVS